jgi:hypothetical protein
MVFRRTKSHRINYTLPQGSENAPKMVPANGHKITPKMAQDGPNMAEDGFKQAPDGPKLAQDAPKQPRDYSRWLKRALCCPKRAQDRPQIAEYGSNMALAWEQFN